MRPEIDTHGSYVIGLLWEFITIAGLILEETKKIENKFYLNGALLLGQNRALVLLINYYFFSMPFPLPK